MPVPAHPFQSRINGDDDVALVRAIRGPQVGSFVVASRCIPSAASGTSILLNEASRWSPVGSSRQCFENAEDYDEEDWDRLHPDESMSNEGMSSPGKPLALRYDFLEICGGSGVVSDQMAMRGLVVGPIIDLTFSLQYDLAKARVIEWLLFMVQHKRVKSIALEPPCTTFSAAAYPPVRSYRLARGFNQRLPKVWIGNRLAFACLCILRAAAHAEVLALLETPRRSKMAWLREWKWLLGLENITETYTASCSFGSPFQKEFRFLLANMRGEFIRRPCARDHGHVRIQGTLTKGSAMYCPGLASALAEMFAKHLRVHGKFLAKHYRKTDGLESIAVNEALKRLPWRVGSCWKWRRASRINVLELSSAFQVLRSAAKKGAGRVVLILDSYVATRCIAKGRSSASSLNPLLRKIMALALAFGISVSVHFGPTRLNIADDPTRNAPLREKLPGMCVLTYLEGEGLYRLLELPKMKRWASNWISLFHGLCMRHSVGLGSLELPCLRCRSCLPPVDFYRHLLDFDAILGYPGEGPPKKVWLACPTVHVVVILCLLACSHGMEPRNQDDQSRAARRQSVPLATGRPVLQVTQTARQKLIEQFAAWLQQRGRELEVLLEQSYTNPELVVDQLVQYGNELYHGGRPYNHYVETINAIGAVKPTIRRMLTGAWDLAFSWLREEPGDHHVACPFRFCWHF